jgi:uncharacterized protein
MKCFYHSADLDGHCSGAIILMENPECEMIGINYGDPFPWESIDPAELVIMVDFSLPMTDMERLNSMTNLVWIDHHASALEAATACGFVANCGGAARLGEAGCELSWQWAVPGRPMPDAVRLLGRYDVWQWRYTPDSLDFQYGMRVQGDTRPDNQELWQALFAQELLVKHVISCGKTILNYEKRQNEIYLRTAGFAVEFDGLRCLAVNKGLTNSLLFASGYDPEQHDAMLAFYRKRSGEWKVSLYSDKPEVDVSAICAARGGGGHKGAAGFQCATLPF